jgi:hypothetical protein
MNAREASIVAVGATGIIIAILGATIAVVGVGWFFAIRNANAVMAEVFDSPDIPVVALTMTMWSSSAVLFIVGLFVSWSRESIARRWILPHEVAEQGTEQKSSHGTVGVGIVGICLAALGFSELFASGVAGWIFGWYSEWDSDLWGAISLLMAGMVLVFRPHWVSRLWRASGADTDS